MKRSISIIIILTAITAFSGCGQQVDLDAHRQALIELNEVLRTAHLAGDAATVATSRAYPYLKITTGQVANMTPQEDQQRFSEYLSTMKLSAWDDIIEPIITISDDATLAIVVYRKHLEMRPFADSTVQPFVAIFAWQSSYRRTENGWKQVSDALTMLPPDQTLAELQKIGIL